MNADEEDDITDELLADAGKLTGLSLELLGLDPHPDDMTPEQRLLFDPDDLAEMAAVPADDRQEAVSQTRLLAGLLWNSSGVLIDQLFRDLETLGGPDAVTRSGIAGSSCAVLAAAAVRIQLRRGVSAEVPGRRRRCRCIPWPRLGRPRLPAAELAVRCLLDQAEITEDIYELDLPEGWRAQVEEVLLEDADSAALYTEPDRTAQTLPRRRRRPGLRALVQALCGR